MLGRSSFHSDVIKKDAEQKNLQKASKTEIEILKEETECPNCHFATLKREGSEIICPVCGYGYRPCT